MKTGTKLNRLFHKLWTRDVGREGYNKQDWKDLEVEINNLEWAINNVCDHEKFDGIYCTEMSCSNYAGKHRG